LAVSTRRPGPHRHQDGQFRRLVCMSLLALVIGACSRNGARVGALPAADDPPPLTHIHGLGINSGDSSLYAAAHSGLYRISRGRASIVANRYQDTMGFTVVGKDHFLASGHPDFREELPPLLGLLESRDAGETWTKKSLLGKADFHALRFAHAHIWGYDSTSSTLMVSKDGKRWDARSAALLRDFVVSPESADVVIASNGKTLMRSEDGGRKWEQTDSPDAPLLLSWEAPDDLWLATVEGLVYRSADSGRTWDERGKLGGQPDAFVGAGDALYAAAHNEIFVSRDDGKQWRTLYSEEPNRGE
jgi:photosystem II stability/assembly factor-like uncharacterized protein